jgi:hypothetical protein
MNTGVSISDCVCGPVSSSARRVSGRPLAVLLTGLALATGAAFSAQAADAPPASPRATDNAASRRANELLKRMGDYLAQAQSFSVSAEIWQDVDLSSGQRVQAGRTLDLQVRRPNGLHAEVHSPRRDRQLIYDGSRLTLFNRAKNFYGSIPAPRSLDQAMDVASEQFGINMPLEDFLRSDPQKDLLRDTTAGVDIGAVSVMGVPCEHLAFTEGNIDWQVWIEDGPQPVPRKFVITYKDEPDAPQFTAIFNKWDFTTKLPDFVFKFEPPPGASQIDVKEMKSEIQSRHAGTK